MTENAIKTMLIGCAALWVTSGVLVLRRQRVAAVVLLVLGALPLLVMSAVPLLRITFAREDYVRQFGQAGLAELPSTAATFCCALLAVVTALASRNRQPWVFALGWCALLPVIAFGLYLALWFRIW